MDETGFKLFDWLFKSLLQDALWYCLKRPWLPAIIFFPPVIFGDRIFASGFSTALYLSGVVVLIVWNWWRERQQRAPHATGPSRTNSKRSFAHLLAEVVGSAFALVLIGLAIVYLDPWTMVGLLGLPFVALLIWGYWQQRRAEQRLANRPPLDKAIRRSVDER